MRKAFPYKRLGRRAPSVLGNSSVWLAADHVLAVHNKRFVEEYRRFDLAEIQAIIIRKQARFIVPAYLALATAVPLAAWITGKARGLQLLTEAGWITLILMGLYWLGVSLFASCSCHIQTAVGSYTLHGLYRYRNARRVLRALEPRIAETQGILPEDWAADDRINLLTTPAADAIPEITQTSRTGILVAVLACVALLLDALISWLVTLPKPSGILRTSGELVTLIAVVLPVVSVVVSRKDKRFGHLRALFLTAVFAVGLANYGNTVVGSFVIAFQRAGNRVPAWVNGIFFWMNQIAEIGVGSLALLHLLWDMRGRRSSGL